MEFRFTLESQSPQTGQFNSYIGGIRVLNPPTKKSQSPQTGQFNSYRVDDKVLCVSEADRSQSPQTGQFNSYGLLDASDEVFLFRLNPLKRVNSILTRTKNLLETSLKKVCLNPLKRVNSILTLAWYLKRHEPETGLNPLKRVNSILTLSQERDIDYILIVSIPSNGSIQFLQRCYTRI